MLIEVVVWGASGHSKVVADILRQTGFTIAGFLDDQTPECAGKLFCGARVLGGASELDRLYSLGVRHAIVGFGDNSRRRLVGDLLMARGFALASAIHPSAIIGADVTIGPGSVVVAGCVLNPSTRIGRGVIVNTCASVDHDCIVEDEAHVGPGANIAGHVEIGRGAWIGIGATVIDHKRVGAGSIVGAGSVVIDDVGEGVVVVGSPARVIKRVE